MKARRWLQISGDPAVREFVFQQMRVQNLVDEHLDEVLASVDILMRKHGVFHAKIHFSTGQVTLWLLNDPLRYRVHTAEDFLSKNVLQIYPCVTYPDAALVPVDAISDVLAEFMRLRALDQHIYLRSGSLNVINGLVGMTFSCDGTHYVPCEDFPAWSKELWLETRRPARTSAS